MTTLNDKEVDWSDTIAIVGAGPAGCVLANRLLETTSHRVLLVERGPPTPNGNSWQDLSAFPSGLNANAQWYSTTPQVGLNQRKLWVHTAFGLGGASLLNAGVFMMGSKENYQGWPGKHFTASNFNRAVQAVCDIHQPKVISQGLMPKDTPAGKLETEIQRKFGYDKLTGKNLLWIEEDGMYVYNASARSDSGPDTKIRRTAADSFLSDAVQANERLTIVTDTTVTRLLTNKTALGVKIAGLEFKTFTKVAGYTIWSTTKQVLGFREVVCSAGAIETPRLLLASGIGPTAELEAAGIPVVLDLRDVGKDLRDHPIAFFPIEMDADEEPPPDFPPCSTPCDNNVTVKTYGKDKKVAFYHMSPHIAYNVPGEILVPRFEGMSIGRKAQVFMLDALRKVIYPTSNTKLGVAAVGLLTTKSKGSIGLDNIDPRYFAQEEDVETFVDAFGDMLQMLKDCRLKVAIPDFDMSPPDREALVMSARMLAGQFWHLCGSCSMGKVVDADTLKVKGTTNLRIIDASIIPVNVEANTQGPVMATAWLAGELF